MRAWVQPCLPGLDYDEVPPVYEDSDDLPWTYDEDEEWPR